MFQGINLFGELQLNPDLQHAHVWAFEPQHPPQHPPQQPQKKKEMKKRLYFFMISIQVAHLCYRVCFSCTCQGAAQCLEAWNELQIQMSWVQSRLVVSLDYLIHGSSGWDYVSMVYFLGVGPKGPALVRFHIITKKQIEYVLYCRVSFMEKIIFLYSIFCL